MKKIFLLFTFLYIVIVNSGCTMHKLSPQELKFKNIKSAQKEIIVDESRIYIQKAYLWRNFQPIVPKGGRPLNVSVRLKTLDGTDFPKTVKVKEAWALYEGKIWHLNNIKERKREKNALDVVIYKGPKLKTDIEIDIILTITDEDGKMSYIKKSSQRIQKVW